ncbi:uncharacterized protein LOC117102760 [Anneissia japonica]|uniref:uncharacterized protein LOC117102760 n=1 Tax=Anneissia japonica TaxID=1529436 RepID=UPI001425767A|nr:uncharacterized protein LOC117102760 [Anneissia japonica]
MYLKTFLANIKWLVWIVTLFLIFKNVMCAEITHSLNDVEVMEDGEAFLICTVKLEEPDVNLDLAWERDHEFIALGTTVFIEKKRYSVNVTIKEDKEDEFYKYKTSILRIRKARLEDAGMLMCYLHSDKYVSVATSADLVVLRSIPRPRCSKVPMMMIIGEKVTLSCTAKQLSYPIELHWWSRSAEDDALQLVKSDQKVVGKKFTLNHTFTVQSNDEGRIFKCRATLSNENSEFESCTTRIIKTSILSVSVQQQNPIIPGDVVCFACHVNDNLKNVEIEYTWSSQMENLLPPSHENIQCFGNVTLHNVGEIVNCTVYHKGMSVSGYLRVQTTTETVTPLSATISNQNQIATANSNVINKKTNYIFGSNPALLYIMIAVGLFIILAGATILLVCHITNKSGTDKVVNTTDIDLKTVGGEISCDSGLVENTTNQHDYTDEQLCDLEQFKVEGSSADIAATSRPCKVHTLNFNIRASTAGHKDMVKHTVSFSGYQCGDGVQYASVEKPQKSTNAVDGVTRSHTQKLKPRSALKPLSKAFSLDQRRWRKNQVEMRAFNDSIRNEIDQSSEPPKETRVPREKEIIYLNVEHHSKDMSTEQQDLMIDSSTRLEAEVQTKKSATISASSVGKTLNIEGLQYADLDFKGCKKNITHPVVETTQYAEIRR